MSHVIPELLFRAWKAKNGDELEVFSINHQRTFCYVDDAIHMIRLLTEGDVGRGQTVNIGNESPEVKIEDIANIVIDTVGRKLRIAPRHATHGSPERRCPRTQLLNSLVSLEGSVSLQDGVRRTYEWSRQEIFANNGITAT